MKNKQDKYFECLEVCIENEQEQSCRTVCTPILKEEKDQNDSIADDNFNNL